MNYYKRKKKVFVITLISLIVINVLLVLSLFFSSSIEKSINSSCFELNANIVKSKTQIHFVDVGQGDSTIFILPDGKKAIIDTGPSYSKERVLKYLEAIGLNKGSSIDYLILTHTDSDHTGNAVSIINNYDIKNIYMPKVYSRFEVENNLIVNDYNINYTDLWYQTCKAINKEVNNENKIYSQKDLIIENSLYNYSFSFYAPFEDKFSNSNNYSPIIIFRSNDFKFMFVGDIDSSIESDFINYYQPIKSSLDVDVLKVAHHGSKNSSSEEFLNFVKPEKAVISCGKDNTYFHPSNEVINRLINNNCEILRTDTTSSVVCGIYNQKIFFQTSYDKLDSFYFCWWYMVVGSLVLSVVLIFCFKIKG